MIWYQIWYQVPDLRSDLVPDLVPDMATDLVPDLVADMVPDVVPDVVSAGTLAHRAYLQLVQAMFRQFLYEFLKVQHSRLMALCRLKRGLPT